MVYEGSQRALFSMLFGAGIILFITRQEKGLMDFTRPIIFPPPNMVIGFWFVQWFLYYYGFGIFYFIMPVSA
ncbi:MAG: hypothetical protein IPQ06_15550 [Chitinophagaceae bacterium]|nr:hypothetical protein [Chitinophagaceae bacterium]